MDYKGLMLTEIGKGFSMSDLEFLIGLPRNNLSSILAGKRYFSKKSLLKIKKWIGSENKPDPLTFKRLVASVPKRENKLINAARGRDESGVNDDEMNTAPQIDIKIEKATIPIQIKKDTEFRDKTDNESGFDYSILKREWKLNNSYL